MLHSHLDDLQFSYTADNDTFRLNLFDPTERRRDQEWSRAREIFQTMTFQMPKRRRWSALTALVLFLLCASSTPTFVAGRSKVKGGYYYAGSSHLLPSSGLNATLFTHLFYAFADVDEQTSTVEASANDLGEMETFSTDMKSSNSEVLTLISISATGAEFATVLQSNASQKAFINSSISLARKFHFDGLDLDWEFARSQEEMDAFGLFIEEWRKAVVAEAEQSSRVPLLLTAAVYFTSTILYTGKGAYPITAIAESLDFINIMCYDFHGSWDVSHTGANANLYDPHSVLSADHGIMSWLEAGLPPEKAVLGLTLYGRSWILSDQKAAAGLNAPAIAAGPAQPMSRTPGIFYYSEVANWIETNNATIVHDNAEVTGYCYANNVWVSYEDPLIISTKVLYAMAKDLRGYFFWEVSYDRNWEVSTAASQAMDNGVPTGPDVPSLAPSPAPAFGAATIFSFSLLLAAWALVISILMLLFSNIAN